MMKNRLGIAIIMCLMLVGFSMTAQAQVRRYERRNGAVVTQLPNGRRIVRRPDGRVIVRTPVRPGWYGRGPYVNNGRVRTYRLPNGRLVTVLPNGRRIIH